MFAKNILIAAFSGFFIFCVPMLNTEALASGNAEMERTADFVAQMNYLSGSEVLQIQMTSRAGDQPLNISLIYKGRVIAKTMEPISKDARVLEWDLSGFPDGAYEVQLKSKYSGDVQRFKKR